MAEELAFARKASGLVRGLSMWDAFGVGFMNQGLTPSIWVMTGLGVSVYLGGNLIWATVISMILAGIGFPIVWGVLGGSMPRSGGEYIYNSRIIHPIVGIGESFGNAFVWIMWIYVLAPWTADPGMVMMSQFMGWDWLYNTATETFFGGLSYTWGCFVIATVANIISFMFVVFGIKWFARIQKVVMLFGIGGCAVLLAAICFYNKADFVAGWNNIAQQYGSLNYDAFLAGVNGMAGTDMPTTWNWFDTFGVMVAGSWLFAYSYCITFIAGEVKRPDKTIILSNLFAIIVPGAFMLWAAVGLYHMVEFNFFSAAMYADYNGLPDGYSVPWSTNFLGPARHGEPEQDHPVHRRAVVLGVQPVVDRALVPRLPAHPLRLGHGPHGSQVVHGHQPEVRQPGEEPHSVLRARPDHDRGVRLLAERIDAGSCGHGARDLLGVRRDRHRGADVPLREALQGHLGRLAVQDVEDRRYPGGDDRRYRRHHLPGHPGVLLLLPARPRKRSRASTTNTASSSP